VVNGKVTFVDIFAGFQTSSDYSNPDSESAEILARILKEPLPAYQDKQANCKLCSSPLPPGYLDSQARVQPIRLAIWAKICRKHKTLELQDEWAKKKYPDIEWEKLPGQIAKHLPLLKKVISMEIESHFRSEFAKQFKETRGLMRILLNLSHKLPFPGYYGPRGGAVLYV